MLVNQTMPEAGQIRKAVSKALNVWERGSKLNFREVYSDQADIQVMFARGDHGDGYRFDGPGQVLAHAFYPAVGRGGDAHFDEEEIWIFNTDTESNDSNYGEREKGTRFIDVAVHEFGHSLGLGHSSDNESIMFAWYHGRSNDNLPNDDRTAIQQLYGSREKTWGPVNRYTTRRTTTRATTTTTTTTQHPLVYYPQYPHKNNKNGMQGHHNKHHQQPYYPYYPDRRRYNTETPQQRTPPPQHPTRTSLRPTMRQRTLKPDTCNTVYDAISMIRSELYIFRGQYLWRIGERGLYQGFPVETRRLWTSLPEKYTKIDAVYENTKGKIIFFIGRHYYVFDSINLERGYPQPLTTLGLPSYLTHIDAAFVWGHNNKTYLFSGTVYWRLDDDTGRVELDYPREMSIWQGIGYNIDAAFQYTDRKTYFFKAHGYWEFNDDRMQVAHARPKISARKWMRCPRRVNDVDDEQVYTAHLVSDTPAPKESGAISTIFTKSLTNIQLSCNIASIYLIIKFFNILNF